MNIIKFIKSEIGLYKIKKIIKGQAIDKSVDGDQVFKNIMGLSGLDYTEINYKDGKIIGDGVNGKTSVGLKNNLLEIYQDKYIKNRTFKYLLTENGEFTPTSFVYNNEVNNTKLTEIFTMTDEAGEVIVEADNVKTFASCRGLDIDKATKVMDVLDNTDFVPNNKVSVYSLIESTGAEVLGVEEYN
ncbi:MAG: hypothetical protein N4A47_05840 [Clostridia bacterium]|jgi:hypothetical protein|nr:hypothetical protein [Clostridia bacterium]